MIIYVVANLDCCHGTSIDKAFYKKEDAEKYRDSTDDPYDEVYEIILE